MSYRQSQFSNFVREYRNARSWSQEELSRRTGLSRPEISAIETGRLVPSTAAALDLADAFGCRVENLFRRADVREPIHAWKSTGMNGAVWRASVNGRDVILPVEKTHIGTVPHDGLLDDRTVQVHSAAGHANKTLVMAGCDPAVGIIASELARSAHVRLIPLIRSSRDALDLLKNGLIHVAGVHLGASETRDTNSRYVLSALGPDYRLLRVARWQAGLALAPSAGIRSVNEAVTAKIRWIGREKGSGARQCLDSIFIQCGKRPREFKYLAFDHRGVAESIRLGWADAGVCIRMTAEEMGLQFISLRDEEYDLCYPTPMEDDPRIVALRAAMQSTAIRGVIGELPGYNASECGAIVDAA